METKASQHNQATNAITEALLHFGLLDTEVEYIWLTGIDQKPLSQWTTVRDLYVD
jgi:hypothetical protein